MYTIYLYIYIYTHDDHYHYCSRDGGGSGPRLTTGWAQNCFKTLLAYPNCRGRDSWVSWHARTHGRDRYYYNSYYNSY